LASVAWTVHLASGPSPFGQEPGLVLATGLVVFTLVDAAGLSLSRGRWAKILGLIIAGAELCLTVAVELGPWSVAAAALAGSGAAGLLGPWTRGWLRMRPAADGPGPRPMVLALGSLALVPVVAIASPSRLEVWHGVLGGGGVLLAWAYSRAQSWSLWGLRVALPILAVPAAAVSPPGGAILLGSVVLALVALAWTKEARLAIDPIDARLPRPRGGTPRGATIGGDE
jgi:hypothetical protein